MNRVEIIEQLRAGQELIEITPEIRIQNIGYDVAIVRFDGDHSLARKLTGCWPDVTGLWLSAADRALDLEKALVVYQRVSE